MDNIISVTQLNKYIKNIFDSEILLQDISIYGEISTYNISNGVAYFSLKDDESIIQCVLFSPYKFKKPNIGDLVMLKGGMNYYLKGGRLSFNAVSIEPYGTGKLYEKFLELKNKLEKNGYFDSSRKKIIPKIVNKIGVVSSPTGAVIQDIRDVAFRRNNCINIVLYPVKVQGIGAENEIANAIDFLSNYEGIDAIIVARGGGSMEDLQPFNTEIVANAVYNCKKPLISAVGHETDYTIIDFCSDLRAPTPSAAAELLVTNKTDLINEIYGSFLNQYSIVYNLIKDKTDYLNKFIYKSDSFFATNLNNLYNSVLKIYNNLSVKIDKIINNLDKKLIMLNSKIELNNPQILQNKGYVKAYSNGEICKNIEKIKIDDIIKLEFVNGAVNTKVVNKE